VGRDQKADIALRSSLRLKSTVLTGPTPEAPARRAATPKAAVGSADYLFHLLSVVSQLRDAELDRRLQPLQLNVGRYRALALIDAFAPCTMSLVASHIPLDRTTISRTIDHLVRAGWVARTKASEDRRQVFVDLTAEGAELFRQARDVVSAHNATLIDGVSDELQAQIIAAQLMLAAKLEPRGGQFVDRQSDSSASLSKTAMVS
jgi:DNA-binding MarR family transcriptional regulator